MVDSKPSGGGAYASLIGTACKGRHIESRELNVSQRLYLPKRIAIHAEQAKVLVNARGSL